MSRQYTPLLNKVIASSLLVAALGGAMALSWVASPDPFGDVFIRSVPLVILILVLVLITLAGASAWTRLAGAIFCTGVGIACVSVLALPEWGVAYLFTGLTMFADLGITANGCQSPMESNANDNFLAVAVVFTAGFCVGYFFELLNVMSLGWWVLSPGISYPMVELSGINVIVIFTYAFIGVLLFELAMLAFMLTRRLTRGKEASCVFTR